MVRRSVVSSVIANAYPSSRPEPPEGRRSGGTCFASTATGKRVPRLRRPAGGFARDDGASIELHSGRVNDLLPFLDLAADALGELFASLTAQLRRLFLPDGLQLGRLQRLHDLLVHAIDDRLR